MSERESLYSSEKAKRTDPWHTVLTSSQGKTRPACTHECSTERSFHSDGVTFLHSTVLRLGPHPGWCLDFHPLHIQIPDISKTQKQTKPLLHHAKCYTLLHFLLYLYTVQLRCPGLFTKCALSKFGERKKQETASFLLTHLLCLLHYLFCSHYFPTSAYFLLYVFSSYVWIRVSFNESLSFWVLSFLLSSVSLVLYFVSLPFTVQFCVCVIVLFPEEQKNVIPSH